MLFSPEEIANDRNKASKLGKLVRTPLRNYGHLTGSDSVLDGHLNTNYHKTAQTFADQFLLQLRSDDIATQLDKFRKQEIEEQRQRLVPIIKTVIVCGRLGLAYRGRRDDGTIDLDSPVCVSDGNFKGLLAFRVDAGDHVLKNHLETTGKNCTYISKTIQNELIQICGNIVAEKIIEEAKQSVYYSILCDETTDSSHKEQLCLCVRFVSESEGRHTLKEEFVQFQAADDLTGDGLANQILSLLNSHGLNLSKLVGQGYDGASAMSGHINGVQANVRKQAALATYVHCSSHVLNLVLNTGSDVHEMRDMFAVIKEVTNFINDSAKRRTIFAASLGESDGRSLVTLCETRFVERHDAIVVFHEQFAFILKTLDKISSSSKDRKAVDNAKSLLRSMTDSGFIVALWCAKKVMSETIILSRSLQSVNQDLFDALDSVKHVQVKLQKWREGQSSGNELSDGELEDQWEEEPYGAYFAAKQLAIKAGVEIVVPRLATRQTQRNNIPADSPSTYFRRAVWYPYLDCILQALRDKFSPHQMTMLKLVALIPSMIEKKKWTDILDSWKMYRSELASEEEVKSEFEQWKAFCLKLNKQSRPETPLEALDIIPSRFSNIRTLLRIFCTLPVTTCTAERAFSAMKLLKNFLRNRMSDERLTGLALMYIHPEIEINIDSVIDRFANDGKQRRFNFI